MSCTDPEAAKLIGGYELGLLSAEKTLRFENHLLNCTTCLQDLHDMAPVADLLRDGSIAPKEKIELPATQGDTEIREPATITRPILGGWRLWPAYAAGIAILVLAGTFAFRTLGPWGEVEHLRGVEEAPVVLFAPIGEVPVPTELEWKVDPGAVSFEVLIRTREGTLLWRIRLDAPPATLPQSVRDNLKPGRTYFWQVEAISEDGERWKSDLTSFTIWD